MTCIGQGRNEVIQGLSRFSQPTSFQATVDGNADGHGMGAMSGAPSDVTQEQLVELGRHGNLDANDTHVVHIVDWLWQYAFEQRASDIHIEPRRDVGKAMRLRDRVRSYFQSTRHADAKTRELVRHIADFDVIRTDTATEALILENELIKRYQPRYNVMLKDSKTYPYLKITNEEWPRIISTRRIVDDGGRYFGPYTSAGSAYRTLNLLNRLFPYRKCDKRITGNEEVCLYYHLHQCTAPCIALVDRATYMKAVDAAIAETSAELVSSEARQAENSRGD